VVIEGRPKGVPCAHTLPEPRHQSVPNEINVLRSRRRLRAVRDRNEKVSHGGTPFSFVVSSGLARRPRRVFEDIHIKTVRVSSELREPTAVTSA
jgi:hypothetical protein